MTIPEQPVKATLRCVSPGPVHYFDVSVGPAKYDAHKIAGKWYVRNEQTGGFETVGGPVFNRIVEACQALLPVDLARNAEADYHPSRFSDNKPATEMEQKFCYLRRAVAAETALAAERQRREAAEQKLLEYQIRLVSAKQGWPGVKGELYRIKSERDELQTRLAGIAELMPPEAIAVIAGNPGLRAKLLELIHGGNGEGGK